MDFKGDGSPLLMIQGAHIYFDTSSSAEFIRNSNDLPTPLGFYIAVISATH
jgi:hypothetical protein